MRLTQNKSLRIPWHLLRIGLVAVVCGGGHAARAQAPPPHADPLLALAEAAADPQSDPDFDNPYADMDLAQLMAVQVTSVAGTEQDWFRTPAAVHVITREDVRRSGHQLLPEVLRLAPGVTVGRFDARQWGISIRGFETLFANKLLVRIDGRTVYDPMFGGTLWDVQDVLLEDLDQIEVVRGPGATLWGANAVNGVINVTTRSAKDTQGGYVTGIYGTDFEPIVAARYGGRLGESTWFRVWGKYLQHDAFDIFREREDRPDDWDMARGGFRLDHAWDDHVTATLDIGGYQSNRLGEGVDVPVPGPVPGSSAEEEDIRDGRASGLHVLGRVERDGAADNVGWSFQAYYDRTDRDNFAGFSATRDTIEVDWRHHFQWGSRDEHETVWGLAYRYTGDRTEDGRFVAMRPQDRATSLYNGFVQHTWNITDTWHVMAGTKVEHNDYTGVEWQPSGRVWWTPHDQHMLWAALSRPVRTPARSSNDVVLTGTRINGGGGAVVPITITGNRAVEAARLLAAEGGWRSRIGDRFTVDVAGFYNRYEDLIATITPTGPPGTRFGNPTGADSYGAEVALTFHPADNWKLDATYSFVQVELDDLRAEIDNETPENQFRISSAYDITEDLELNAALYVVEQAKDSLASAYARLDVGATCRVGDHLELSVWGQNLTEDEHIEQGNTTFLSERAEVPRSVYVQATWRF